MNTAKASTPAPVAAPLTVIHVPFRGDSIDAVHDGGRVWVPVRKVCDVLGLGFGSQTQKLHEKPWATVTTIVTVAEDGKQRETLCLDLDSLPMWLATIDTKRVAPAAREKLVVYQRECARVLREHFFGKREKLSQSEADRLRSAAFAGPRPGRFLPEADELTREQVAHFFGPQLGRPKKNDGRVVRLALGLDEDSRFDDSTQFMKMLWVELEMLERVARMHARDLRRDDEERDTDDEKETAELLSSALWNLRNRTKGTSSLLPFLAEARRYAEDSHRPDSGASKKYHELSPGMQRARDNVALESLREREGDYIDPETQAYLDHCVRAAKDYEQRTGKVDLVAEFEKFVKAG